ncbi:hypothetical protein Lac1_23100 [Claveliimonas bilis]|uniref:Uncharacterized protein n=1 Tax=Claveliimonas bilis TaxID=3028070 RepID=A0ABM8IA11_9FIRM|nr:hypothetical protein Lac1_23100 [Claveliimonas bilis]
MFITHSTTVHTKYPLIFSLYFVKFVYIQAIFFTIMSINAQYLTSFFIYFIQNVLICHILNAILY